MADLMEGIIVQASLAVVALHRRELALIPALRDACCDVEDISRYSEQILSLTSTVRDVMCKVACLSCNFGIRFAGRIPSEWSCTVIRAGGIVMVEDSIPIFISGSHGEICLTRPRHVSWSNCARRR